MPVTPSEIQETPQELKELASRLPSRMFGFIRDITFDPFVGRNGVYEIQITAIWKPHEIGWLVRPSLDFMFRHERPDLQWSHPGPYRRGEVVELILVKPLSYTLHEEQSEWLRGDKFVTVNGIYDFRPVAVDDPDLLPYADEITENVRGIR